MTNKTMAIVITVAQQKGGAGKSTVSAHLAVAFSQRGQKVILIDIDPQGSTTHWYRVRQEKFGDDYTGLGFVKANGLRLSNEIARYKDSYDIIIVDSPPHTESESKTAIRASDLVVVPVQPSPTDIWAMSATIELARAEEKLFRVLLNRYSPGSRIAKELDSSIPIERFTSHLGNRVVFASCMLLGKCVTESDPSSQAAEEVKNLIAEVNDLLIKEGILTLEMETV